MCLCVSTRDIFKKTDHLCTYRTGSYENSTHTHMYTLTCTHSRAAGDGGESDSGEVFILSQCEAVLDGFLEVGHSVSVAPRGTVHVDHKLAWQLSARATDGSCKERVGERGREKEGERGRKRER